MRAFVVVAVLLAFVSPAAAKRISCTSSIGPGPVVTGDMTPPTATLYGIRIDGSAIWINGAFSPDTSRLHVTYNVDDTPFELWTTPQHPYVCTPDRLYAGTRVSVAAIDEAGNATSNTVTAYDGRPRHFCGMGGLIVFLFVVFVGAIGVAIVMFIVSAVRRRKLKWPGIALTPLAADSILRATIRELDRVLLISLALVIALVLSDDMFYGVLVSWVPSSRLLRVTVARRMLAQVERGALAVLHDNLLATPGSRRVVIVPRSIRRDIERFAVPTAKISPAQARGSAATIDESPPKP